MLNFEENLEWFWAEMVEDNEEIEEEMAVDVVVVLAEGEKEVE